MSLRALGVLALVLFASPPSHAEETHVSSLASAATPIDEAFRSWSASHGEHWRCSVDRETGFVEMIFGGRGEASFHPRDDADFIGLARAALAETEALHGIEASTLVPERVLFLPLGASGSSDKLSVRLRQAVGGVRVAGGFVNVLFDASGRWLSIQSTALPRAAQCPTSPELSRERAARRALELFAADTSRTAASISAPELVIDRNREDKTHTPCLAWQIDVVSESAASVPDGFRYWIDAQDGRLVRKENDVHTFDVTGTVSSLATPGVLPDTASNPPVPQAMPYMTVTSAQGSTTTDAAGNFTFVGVNTPLDVTVGYSGDFNQVVNTAGANFTLTQSLLPGQPNSILMNAGPTDTITSQANAYHVVGMLRDFVHSVNPNDATADFLATSNVNIAQNCNAFYDGVSLNFFAAGTCVNSAYSTVISHEHGHWMNDRYGTGNGGDGMGEGNADVWAMYVWDNPIVGQDFAGPGASIRTGLNTRPFCGDANSACYGEVHADGEPWMGAAWKVRARLDASLGHAQGNLVADSLFLGWMNAYDQMQIKSIIETQWLTLDDDDGNIDNGTPHYADIDAGFRAQAFPGFDLPIITIADVTEIADTANEAGPFSVHATIVPDVAPQIATASLRYRKNGGTFQYLAMTNSGGNSWRAIIPGTPSPARIEYYVQARDSLSNVATFPKNAPAATLDFDIGVPSTFFFDDFETAGDNGWTHASALDTSNHQDDWQHDTPVGKSGTSLGVFWNDPPVAASGTRCWGNDLGLANFDGAYQPNVHNYLLSPPIDCSTEIGTHVRFKRWLTVEESIYDHARVLVNGNVVWHNPEIGNTLDTSWTSQVIDIAAYADGNPAVQVQFDLRSDGGLNLGGWQIDDFEVMSFGPSGPCAPPANYCSTSPNSAGAGAFLASAGSTSIAADDFVLIANGCPPSSLGLFFYGAGQTQTAFGNGFLCVGGTIHRLPIQHISPAGDVGLALDYNNLPAGGPIQTGQTWNFQFWYRNPAGGGAGFNLSDGLAATFCP